MTKKQTNKTEYIETEPVKVDQLYKMKSILLHDKVYFEVNERVKFFRRHPVYKHWSIRTEIIESTENTISMKAIIEKESGDETFIMSEGIAHEDKRQGNVNKTSHYENCQTSAVGRALGFLDIGIDDSLASADEVKQAISLQDAFKKFDETDKAISELCLKDNEYLNMIDEIEAITDIDDLKPAYQKYKDKKFIGYLLQRRKEEILKNKDEIFE